MSKFDELLEEELEKQKKKQTITVVPASKKDSLVTGRYSYLPTYQSDDIAPIFTTTKKKDDDDIAPIKSSKDDGKLDFFQKGAFDDGYQVGDITKTILGTVGDAGVGVVKGVGSLGEGLADLIGYGMAGIADATGHDAAAKRFRKGAQENMLDSLLKPAEDYLDKYSVLGRTSDSIMQGVGQVGGILATGHIGAAAGLGSAAVNALTTGVIGLSGMGSGMGEAYRGGATDGEAALYGAISGTADAITELLFGGLGKAVNAMGLSKGLSSADDILAKKVSSMFSNQIMKNFSEYGIKAGAEGLEEVLAGIAQAAGKKATYMSEEEFGKILQDENLLEQFVVGSVTSGIAQAPSLNIANKTGTDFITGLNQNEQAVVDKEVENRIAEAEKDGKKLTAKEKSAIQTQVEKDLEKGYISTDLIEEVVGGDTYKTYRESVDSEDALFKEYEDLGKTTNPTLAQQYRYRELDSRVKSIKDNDLRSKRKEQLDQFVAQQVNGSRLAESYNEKARRGQKFEADLTKYDKKQQATIQKAIDSGFMNNTNRTHEFVDFVAKVSAQTGTAFDFTTNEKLKETGFAMEGVVQNGFKTKDGITLNMSSNASRRFVVGHEITHVLEGTDLYSKLQEAVFDYAKTKGEYDSRLESITALYQKYAPDADPLQELTADLVGEYIFSDQDFVNNLSVKNQNVFQKIYGEIKHLLKLATAGSQEARMLEKAKRAFEKAYRENSKAQGDTKYSISETTDGRYAAVVDNDILSNIDTSSWDDAKKAEAKKAATEALKQFKDGIVVDGVTRKVNKVSRREYTRSNYTEALYNNDPDVFADKMRAADVADDLVVAATNWSRDGGLKHPRSDNFVDFDHGKTLIVSGNAKYTAEVVVGITDSGDAVFYDVVDMTPATFEVKKEESPTTATTQNAIGDIQGDSSFDRVAQNGADVKYSLSDSDGRQLSKEQQEYFKDSVVRDENGNLKVMYHGTMNGGFTVFGGKKDYWYFTDDKKYAYTFEGRKANGQLYPSTKEGIEQGYYNPERYKVYLNVTNPFITDDVDVVEDALYWDKSLAGKLREKGYDALMLKDMSQVIVLNPNQIKNVDNAKPTENPDIRYSLSNAETDKTYLDAVNNGDMETARKIVEKVAQRRGYTIHAYHGTARGDRVGNVFLPERATSGPMAFFTDNKEIAENYSKSKQDTSMAYDPDYDRYETQFRIKVLDRDIPLYRAWGYLPFDARRRITQKAGQLRENWDGDNELILDPDTNEANGGFQWQLKEARGNAIQALTEQWLNSGNLFNEEGRFLDVLEMAGVTEEFKKVNGMGELYFKDPNAKHEKVYDTFLRIRKPFDTATVDEQFIADLESWYEEQDQSKYVRENMQSDMWDKNGIDAYDFADRLRSDLENNTTHAWTSIPDSVTDYLKHLGYDGIKDTGGKFTLEGHTVWIPFASSQIKSAETVTYDDAGNVIPITERFDRKEVDIRQSISEEGQQPKAYGRYNVYGKDIALSDALLQEEVATVAENATTAPTVSKTETVPEVAISKTETTTEAPVTEESSVAEMFPDDLAPLPLELDKLMAEQAELRTALESAMDQGDYSQVSGLTADYEAVTARIREIQAQEDERFSTLGEADMPPEAEAPYPGEPSEPADPFADRDMHEVGKRNVKAYQYENPEVKPFFREAALGMLDDLHRGTKGEKIFNGDVYYQTGGEYGWDGTKRSTTSDIAALLDEWHYTYAEIEEGLNAIIEDHGKENNAASKRIEFMLDDRLRNGYTDVWGEVMPANQEYINLLNEKQITEYSKEAFERFMATADQYAPPVEEDIGPVKQKPMRSEQMKLPLYHDPNNVSPAMGEVQTEGDIAPMFETESGQQAIFEPVTSENAASTRKALHARIMDNIKAKFAQKGFDFDKVLKEAKNLSTFATVDNTPQRVMEKALGYKEGGILSDITVNQVAQNETQGIKWLNSFTDRKNGLLAQISKQYNIKPGSKESAAAQMYAEGFYVGENNEIISYGDRELAVDFPDKAKQAQIKGLARDPRIRKIYDETLKAINESRTRTAYPEIPRLDNYFLHFRAMNDTFSKLGLPFNPNDIRAKDLPTDLNGVTADLKPGQPYFASAMHREGKRTSFDLLGGLEQYLTSAKNQIYHIDDIQNLRALRNYIADTYGQANGLEGLDVLSEEEAQDRIEQVYGSHLSTFAKFLNEEANVLAGKTALIDRGLEGIIGRRGMTFLDTLNRQVGANMVGYNVSSSLTNFLAPVQAFAKTNKAAFIKGMAQFASNKVQSIYGNGDGFAEQSPVMIRRKGAERFNRTLWQKMSDPGYMLMSAVDDVSTELIARAKYNEFVGKGMDSQKAHIETDKWVSRLMGDRSLGQQPQLYNSKMLGIVTKFQLEVRNQLDSQFYDTIQEAKVSNEDIENRLLRNAKTAAKVTSTFVQLAVAQHLFGKVFESVAGYNPAFDIISAIIKTFGWDDEEESEDTVLDNIEQGFMELLEDMPYASTFTGGRIPISSALPVAQFIKGKDQYGNEKSRWETLGEAAPYYLMPGGYGQVKKTMAGLDMFSDEHPIAGSYTDSGNLRFPVEDTLASRAQAAVFGQYASSNARDYFDNERKALNPKQTQEFADVGISVQDYWKYREGLSGLSTLEQKLLYINSLNLTTAQKNILANNLTDRKDPIDMSDYDEFGSLAEFDYANSNPEKYAFFENIGITYEIYQNADDDAKDAYDWAFKNPEKYTMSKAVAKDVVEYRRYASDLYDIKADKDEDGKSISGSRKEKVLDYINSLDIDYGAKLILFKNEYNSDDESNYEIIDYLNSREDISFEEEVTILRELGFTVTEDGTIYWD